MKRALICGIPGQDGSYLAKLLIDNGYEVIGTSRDTEMSGFSNLFSLVSLAIRGAVTLRSMTLDAFRSVIQVLKIIEPMWVMLQRGNARDYVIATGQNNTLSDFITAVLFQPRP